MTAGRIGCLSVEGISVARGARRVVEDVSFEARGGEVLGLVGPNGAGKSSLLRAIACLVPRAAGRARVDGEDLAALSPRERARRLAFLPQGHEVNWPISVERLAGLGRLPHRGPLAAPSPADREATERAMRRAGVKGFRDRPASGLSGGERARALLARALAVEAPMLLADEPVASLDPYHQLRVMELMRETAAAGDLVIVVLHDLALAARFCDRLAVMGAGRLLAFGPPEAALSPDRLAEAYRIGALHGERDGERFVLPWRRIDGAERAGS
ncbi:ABC transporter ATP-binding protein [Albimonas pacifica]|uniref:Iron complex transport system ATP-binding protein n=1 Tax=Albimonas pacifica TaxID=1114924 RepID=A0A1I3FRU1_9RHOB|nr:ABC transporter ATP-binding protein [Albimonas pacifica]SFI13919.1 iron complex transport system ATP-binding protein [Albimonas pacifica]